MKLRESTRQPKYQLVMGKEEFDAIKARRAELLVELFLDELNPVYVAKVNSEEKRELPFDYLVFLQKGSALLAFGVSVMKSESFRVVQVSTDESLKLTGSTLPILIATIDIKEKQFFSNWASEFAQSNRTSQHKLQLKEGKEHIHTFFARKKR